MYDGKQLHPETGHNSVTENKFIEFITDSEIIFGGNNLIQQIPQPKGEPSAL